jgi:hypothetical protein
LDGSGSAASSCSICSDIRWFLCILEFTASQTTVT